MAVWEAVPAEDPRLPLHSRRARVCARPGLRSRLCRRRRQAQSAVLAERAGQRLHGQGGHISTKPTKQWQGFWVQGVGSSLQFASIVLVDVFVVEAWQWVTSWYPFYC